MCLWTHGYTLKNQRQCTGFLFFFRPSVLCSNSDLPLMDHGSLVTDHWLKWENEFSLLKVIGQVTPNTKLLFPCGAFFFLRDHDAYDGWPELFHLKNFFCQFQYASMINNHSLDLTLNRTWQGMTCVYLIVPCSSTKNTS